MGPILVNPSQNLQLNFLEKSVADATRPDRTNAKFWSNGLWRYGFVVFAVLVVVVAQEVVGVVGPVLWIPRQTVGATMTRTTISGTRYHGCLVIVASSIS
jgi:hypothetical protein